MRIKKYTVRDLIKDLKKMPQDVGIIFQCHDNSENEVQDYILNCNLVDFDKLPKSEIGTTGKWVALRS